MECVTVTTRAGTKEYTSTVLPLRGPAHTASSRLWPNGVARPCTLPHRRARRLNVTVLA